MRRNELRSPARGELPAPNAALRVVFDALAARYGGTAYAVAQLAGALGARHDVERVVVVTRAGSIVEDRLQPHHGLRVVRLEEPGALELPRRLAWEAARLPAIASHHEADGLFSFSGIVPRRPRCPVISLLANPVPFEDKRRLGSLLRRAAIARTSRRAAAVYVPSAHVERLVGAGQDVRVVPLGVDRSAFKPRADGGSELLCVADFYRHKHHEALLRAHAALDPPRPLLRLIGNPDVDPAHFRRISRLAGEVEDVRVDGQVSFSTLLEAYAAARAFLIASTRESFSMPLAEALCCGVPAVALHHPTLLETGGPGALYVRGHDSLEWAAAIARIVRDDRLHTELRAAGLRHASRYSWSVMAEQIVKDLAAPTSGQIAGPGDIPD